MIINLYRYVLSNIIFYSEYVIFIIFLKGFFILFNVIQYIL